MTASAVQSARRTVQPGEDERAPKYAVLPTGSLVNRAVVAGVLTNIDLKESDAGNDVAHIQITDQAGDTVWAYPTKEYNTEVYNELRALEENDEEALPIWVVVVGKPSPFQTEEDGDWLASLDIEAMNHVNQATVTAVQQQGADAVADMVEAFQAGSAEGEAFAAKEYEGRETAVELLARDAHDLLSRTVGVDSELPSPNGEDDDSDDDGEADSE